MNDRNMIPALLRLFPSEWRSEYGIELSSLLEREPLPPAIVWNVVQSAIYQRVLSCPAWVKAAGVPGCWFLIGLIVNSIWAMSAAQYTLFWNSCFPMEIGLGYWLSRIGSSSPGRGHGVCSASRITAHVNYRSSARTASPASHDS